MNEIIQTKRLILRKWREEDFLPFAALNACPHVCKYLAKTLTQQESNDLAQRIISHFDKHGFGLYAAERKDTHQFIGFTGLSIPNFEAHFMPAIEIGWRLSYTNWGQGFATEAAKAVSDYAFDALELNEIVSFTTKNNTASRRVMEKIGMTHKQEDNFDHPSLHKNHPLKEHVLYRLSHHNA
tara:strand:+ start:1546 stop:2091 length:546 start_codon:yes stop_codon:yes gene_type:complete